MTPFEHWYIFWAAITAVATGATCLVVVLAAIFTYRQVREAGRARKLEGALAVLTHVSSPELRRVRRLITTHHTEINGSVNSNPAWEELDTFLQKISHDEVDFAAFHTYLASLENVSILVLHELAPDEIVEMYFARIAPTHWNSLQNFIHFMRSKYGASDYLQHFEMLNKLMALNALSVDKRSLLGFPSRLRSTRAKRRLLKARREQLIEELKEEASSLQPGSATY